MMMTNSSTKIELKVVHLIEENSSEEDDDDNDEMDVRVEKHPKVKDRKVRKSGLDVPFSLHQIFAIILHLSSAITFQVVIHHTLLKLVHALLLTLLIVLWYYCSSVNPENGKSIVLHSERWKNKRYCFYCHKSSFGLDHHCLWLNSCVTIKTYVPFISLIVVGLLLNALQSFMSLFYIINDGPSTIYVVVFSQSIFPAICFTSVLTFHSYLALSDKTTYSYVYQQKNHTSTI